MSIPYYYVNTLKFLPFNIIFFPKVKNYPLLKCKPFHIFVSIFCFFNLTVLCGMWCLSSPGGDQTCSLCIGIAES